MTTPLERTVRERIVKDGPVSLETVMAEANATYYARGDGLGAAGDFITAPEISQVFGELIGLWMAVVWQGMGAPTRVGLVECGPGRGTLMADALRALALVPAFRNALDVHLVETSPTLRARQREVLPEGSVTWHDTLDTVPEDRPLLLVANEFLDALPIRQYVRRAGGWRLRRVGMDGPSGPLTFVEGEPVPADDLDPTVRAGAPEGAIAEVNPAGRAFTAALSRRLVAQGGAALLIDYGHARAAAGDTLQAVRRHHHHPVLRDLGAADLTAHVDFQAVAESARAAGASVRGPVEQGEWLIGLGVEARAAMLRQGATPDQDRALRSAVHRLIDPREMGRLFRVIALAAPNMAPPPGFDGT